MFVTVDPQYALRFLSSGSEQKYLIYDAIPNVPSSDIFLVKTYDATIGVVTDVYIQFVAFWPTGLGQGTSAEKNQEGFPISIFTLPILILLDSNKDI